MKWVAIAGSWRRTNKEIEKDVRKTVNRIIVRGDGVISGGALGVDYFALDEVMKLNPSCKRIKIFLPAKLDIVSKHFFQRADEGVITKRQAEDLINQLKTLQKANPKALIEDKDAKVLNKTTYYKRILKIIDNADQLVAFHVNKSKGTQYTIDKAKEKNIPVRVNFYNLN